VQKATFLSLGMEANSYSIKKPRQWYERLDALAGLKNRQFLLPDFLISLLIIVRTIFILYRSIKPTTLSAICQGKFLEISYFLASFFNPISNLLLHRDL
jgi:sensor histidine kinase YesM